MSKYGLTVGGHGVMDGIHIYIYILQVCINEFPCLCMNYTSMKLVFGGC